jgi:hypothetical protein
MLLVSVFCHFLSGVFAWGFEHGNRLGSYERILLGSRSPLPPLQSPPQSFNGSLYWILLMLMNLSTRNSSSVFNGNNISTYHKSYYHYSYSY